MRAGGRKDRAIKTIRSPIKKGNAKAMPERAFAKRCLPGQKRGDPGIWKN